MRHLSHLNTTVQLLNQYDGKEPFSHFIKNFFKQHKKFGSTDRKTISHFCYCYFRLGHALKNISVEEKILAGIFLCSQTSNELLAHLKPKWNENIQLNLEQKLSIINYPLFIKEVFPWKDELSTAVDYEKFCKSFLIQPDLFLRIRPGNEDIVKRKLTDANIAFAEITGSCISLPNSTKIEDVIEINKEAVVQDYSSQQIGNFFPSAIGHSPFTSWDCCAASGGKSIMLYDMNNAVDITVSDIRKSILLNLEKRFSEAGIKKYRSFVADLAAKEIKAPSKKYDLIIADVPCSGSGTWSRNPEALVFFNKEEIEKYSNLQKKILDNVLPHLSVNGRLVYITCSVFKKENEEIADYIQQKFQLRLQQ
ncbi:MAG: Fmu (Sun) domain-containing protein, partial [Bacteroidetes bacterium]|nr:Fmu (Sun) domain-containing protein [Bacteroidota bacterium]